MRLKSLSVTNQRIKRTCVANIFMLCLLTSQVWSFANMKHNRFARQLDDEMQANYEDTSITNPYHQPHFAANRSVVVQLFEWKFVDIAAECRDFLGPQGYAGVQVSPVLEHTVLNTGDLSHPWWERLEVVSYRLASRSGDETEFWSMSRICNEHGVRIYVDVVLNHMAAPLHYMGVAAPEGEAEDYVVSTLLETNVNLAELNYSHVPYTHNDFHKPTCMVSANTQDAHVIRNCQLNGHPDLDHSHGNVQKRIVKMLNKFVDMGVAGFRIDKAKYMWPIDLKNIFKQVKNLSTEFNFKKNSRPFLYYDVFDLGLDAVSKTEYSTYGVVSEYLYGAELSTILRGQVPLSSLINWGPALGFLPHDDSLVFIDSPDTQRGLPRELGSNRMLTYKQRIQYIMANIFMLVHPYGAVKRIMSSYYFPTTDTNQGPPTDEANGEEIRSPQYDERKQCTKDSGWVCEHRWPQIVNAVKVANYFRATGNKEESIIYFQTNGPNQVAFCRGQKAFVAINNDAENDFVKHVYACLEPGFYCDILTGGKKDGLEECKGKILEINEQGYIKLELNAADDKRGSTEEGIEAEGEQEEEKAGEIQSYGMVVIYVESKIEPGDKSEADKEIIEADTKQTDAEEGSSEKDEKTEDKPSAEEEQDVEGKENEDTNNKAGDPEDPEDVVENGVEKGGEKGEQENGEEGGERVEEKSEEIVEDQEVGTSLEESSDPEGNQNANDPEETAEAKGSNEGELSDQEVGTSLEESSDPEGNQNANDPEETAEAKGSNEGELSDQEVGASLEESSDPEGNQNESDPEDTAEAKGDNEGELSEEKETEVPNEEENIEVVEEEDHATAEDSPKEDDELQNPRSDSVEDPSGHETAEPEPATSADAGNNQSRNLDDKNAEDAEEQIEKPSAEVVDEAGDISDAVTAKIQDIQKSGVLELSSGQPRRNNG